MKVYIILLLNTSNFKLLGSVALNLSLGEDPNLRRWQTFKGHDQQENNAITKTSMIFKSRHNLRYLPTKVSSHLPGINITNSYKTIYSNNSVIFPYDIDVGRNVLKKRKMDLGYGSMLHRPTELMTNLDSGKTHAYLSITLRGNITNRNPQGIVKGSSPTIKNITTTAIANDIFNIVKSNGDGDQASGTSGANTDPGESGLDENAPENRSLLLAKFLIGKMLHKYHHHHHHHHPPSQAMVEHSLILPRPMSFLRPPVQLPLTRPAHLPQPLVYVPVPIPISVCKFPNCVKSTRRGEKVPYPPTKDKEILLNMPPNPPLPRPKPRPKPNQRPHKSNLPYPTDLQTYAPYHSYPPYPPYPHTYAPYPPYPPYPNTYAPYPPYPPYPPTETYAPYEPYPTYPPNTNTYAPYPPYPSYPPYSDTYAPYPSYPPYSDTYAPYPPYPTYPPYAHTYAPYPPYPPYSDTYAPYPPYPTYPPNTYTYATYAPYPSNTYTYAPYQPYPTYAPYPSSSVTYHSYPSPTTPISPVDTLESPETDTPTPEAYENKDNPYYELLLK